VEISLPETAEPFAEEELPESSTPVEEEPSLADSPDAQNESAPPESVPQKSLPEEPAPKEVWPLRQEELTGVAQPVKKSAGARAVAVCVGVTLDVVLCSHSASRSHRRPLAHPFGARIFRSTCRNVCGRPDSGTGNRRGFQSTHAYE